jgi:hypothetical protein
MLKYCLGTAPGARLTFRAYHQDGEPKQKPWQEVETRDRRLTLGDVSSDIVIQKVVSLRADVNTVRNGQHNRGHASSSIWEPRPVWLGLRRTI